MHLQYHKSISLVHSITRFTGATCFLIFLYWLVFANDVNIKSVSLLVIVSTVSQVIILVYNRSIYNSGLFMIFYAYTALVHNGFVIAHFLDDSYSTFQSITSMAFLHNEYYPKAILIANIVIWMYVFSAELSPIDSINYNEINKKKYPEFEEGDRWADIIGILLLAFGTLYLAYLVFSKGLWMVGYVNSLHVTGNLPFYSHTVVITSLSMALVMSSGTKKGIIIALILFLADSVLHFSIGNRGEVMYAAVVCFALYSIRYKTIKLKHILLAGLGMVILIPIVRIARELRFDAYTFNPFTSLLDVLCEEGLQISPFTYIVQYVENGHPHVWGMTYISTFQDFLLRRVGDEGTLLQEAYVIKKIMPYDGMAFTMIGELYYNFSVVGACIVYILFAQWIKKLDQGFYTGRIKEIRKIFYSMLMVEMINLTRNDATTLPLYLVWSLIIIAIFRIVGNLSYSRNQRI